MTTASHDRGAAVADAVWIILLNWNQFDLTDACLKSLQASTHPNIQIVVVDNGSTDGSAERLRSRYPSIHLLPQKTNLGFSEGNNVGIRHALDHGADLVCLLNNDTEVAPDSIERLQQAAREHPDSHVFGGRIYYHDRRQILWYAGGDVDLSRPMAVVHHGMELPDGDAYALPQKISFVTGCCLATTRAVIAKVGLLDDDLFSCAEDVDWCIRARQAGFQALYVPGLRVWHKVSQSYRGRRARPAQVYLSARNRFIVQQRYAGRMSLLGLIPKYLLSRTAWRTYRAMLSGNTLDLRALALGIWDGWRQAPRRYPRVDAAGPHAQF